MCGPVLPLVATGLSAIGTGISTVSAMRQADAQASAAQANAQLESNAAQIDQQNMRQAAMQQYRQMASTMGEQRVAAAANGVVPDFGTPANAVNDTQVLGNEDLQRLYTQGNQTLIGHDIAVANDQAAASAATGRGQAALFSGLAGLGASAIGAASGGSGAGFGPNAFGGGSIMSQSSFLGGANQYGDLRAALGL